MTEVPTVNINDITAAFFEKQFLTTQQSTALVAALCSGDFSQRHKLMFRREAMLANLV